MCPYAAGGLDWRLSALTGSIAFYLSFPFLNVIDNFVCDMYPLLKLSCSNTHLIGLSMIANGGAICTAVFFILLVPYGVILQSLKTHSLEGNHKASYRCASHMMVVILFFVPCIFLYASANSTLPIDKSMTVVLTHITLMLNPLIYTLRNAEMKNAMRKLWSKNVTLIGRGCVGHDFFFFFGESKNSFNISDYN